MNDLGVDSSVNKFLFQPAACGVFTLTLQEELDMHAGFQAIPCIFLLLS